MRFLVDTNLPRALSRWIAANGHMSEHVLDLGMGQADDTSIWDHATARAANIISKDEDFARLVRQDPSGTGVIWLRTGNGTTPDLLALLGPPMARDRDPARRRRPAD